MSSEGRIGRFIFIVRLIGLGALALITSNWAIDYFAHWHEGHFSAMGPFLGIVIGLICALTGLMQLLKRLRDMGRPAYWTILMLVPGVNVCLLLYVAIAPSRSN